MADQPQKKTTTTKKKSTPAKSSASKPRPVMPGVKDAAQNAAKVPGVLVGQDDATQPAAGQADGNPPYFDGVVLTVAYGIVICDPDEVIAHNVNDYVLAFEAGAVRNEEMYVDGNRRVPDMYDHTPEFWDAVFEFAKTQIVKDRAEDILAERGTSSSPGMEELKRTIRSNASNLIARSIIETK